MRNKSKWHLTLPIGLVILLTISVVACGQPPSNIAMSPQSFSFSAEQWGDNPASQPLIIWNSGEGTLDWAISDNVGWLSLSPTSGSSTDGTEDVTVSVDIYGMDIGSHSAIITISAPGALNSPQIIPVKLNITQAISHYVDSTYGYSFDYPSAWILYELPDEPGFCFVYSPNFAGPSRTMGTFPMEVKDAPVQASVDIWIELEQDEEDFTILNNRFLTNNWDWLLEYTYTTQDGEESHCWAHFKGTADLQFIAKACIEEYEANLIPDELQMIMDSFEFAD